MKHKSEDFQHVSLLWMRTCKITCVKSDLHTILEYS